MSLRIGGNISSLYNASRINQTPDIDKTSRIEQQATIGSELQDSRSSAGQYVSQDHGGVLKTRVADANSFQKTQLDGTRGRIEDMADKLFNKLPDIFADMKKLPEETENQTAASRVSVTERNVAAVADRQAAEQDQLGEIRRIWDLMNTSYDKFIRTTDEDHEKQVQKIFKKLYDQGDIYKGSYEGMYCTPCESFWTESQLVDGKCPDCGRPVQPASEEAYFFKMSKYAPKLIQYIEDHPEFIQPLQGRTR